jgi:hypothetical protein
VSFLTHVENGRRRPGRSARSGILSASLVCQCVALQFVSVVLEDAALLGLRKARQCGILREYQGKTYHGPGRWFQWSPFSYAGSDSRFKKRRFGLSQGGVVVEGSQSGAVRNCACLSVGRLEVGERRTFQKMNACRGQGRIVDSRFPMILVRFRSSRNRKDEAPKLLVSRTMPWSSRKRKRWATSLTKTG